MEYVRLGWSGLKVSKICMGTMSFGDPTLQQYGGGGWISGKEDAFKVMNRAWDLGINFYDTANVYSMGKAEEIVGEFMQGRREDAVIATKVYFPTGERPNDSGLSRKHVFRQINESLRRLRTDYVDLYQIHRWDYGTEIDEVLSALTDLVRQGKTRYVGASSMWAWQLATAYYMSEFKGYEKFVSMQNLYNLLYREEEREMVPFCKKNNIAIIPYSPNAVGVLSGRYMRGGRLAVEPGENERLQASSGFYAYNYYIEPPENAEIVRRVMETAKKLGVTPTQVALAWLFKKGVTAPIIATTKVEHLEDAVGALNVNLSDDNIKYLEEPYKPKAIIHIK
ncbi:MAG: aldo/keto reductase [Candidatus Bathyarchaeia archaeon]